VGNRPHHESHAARVASLGRCMRRPSGGFPSEGGRGGVGVGGGGGGGVGGGGDGGGSRGDTCVVRGDWEVAQLAVAVQAALKKKTKA
jgi:hypothetical protein